MAVELFKILVIEVSVGASAVAGELVMAASTRIVRIARSFARSLIQIVSIDAIAFSIFVY